MGSAGAPPPGLLSIGIPGGVVGTPGVVLTVEVEKLDGISDDESLE